MKDFYYQISVSEYSGKNQYHYTEVAREYDKDKAINSAYELANQIKQGNMKLAQTTKSFCVCISEFKYNYLTQSYRHSPVDSWSWATRDYVLAGNNKWK
jgi:hypothetical protein